MKVTVPLLLLAVNAGAWDRVASVPEFVSAQVAGIALNPDFAQIQRYVESDVKDALHLTQVDGIKLVAGMMAIGDEAVAAPEILKAIGEDNVRAIPFLRELLQRHGRNSSLPLKTQLMAIGGRPSLAQLQELAKSLQLAGVHRGAADDAIILLLLACDMDHGRRHADIAISHLPALSSVIKKLERSKHPPAPGPHGTVLAFELYFNKYKIYPLPAPFNHAPASIDWHLARALHFNDPDGSLAMPPNLRKVRDSIRRQNIETLTFDAADWCLECRKKKLLPSQKS